MPRFDANLWFLFPDLEMPARFAAARDAGFEAVEINFPYGWPAKELQEALDVNGLRQVLINLPPGDWQAGERGLAALPGREADFRAAVDLGRDYAVALGVRRVHCMAGLVPVGADREAYADTFVMNLAHCCRVMAEEGINVLVEALNPVDVPGYLIGDTAAALAVLDAVGAPNLRLQYDLYHGRVNGADLLAEIAANLDRIDHMQVADKDDRGEPVSDTFDYPALFRAIDELGYRGWIGCEYAPRGDTREGLRAWGADYGLG